MFAEAESGIVTGQRQKKLSLHEAVRESIYQERLRWKKGQVTLVAS